MEYKRNEEVFLTTINVCKELIKLNNKKKYLQDDLEEKIEQLTSLKLISLKFIILISIKK